jgi:hypothetical protein
MKATIVDPPAVKAPEKGAAVVFLSVVRGSTHFDRTSSEEYTGTYA